MAKFIEYGKRMNYTNAGEAAIEAGTVVTVGNIVGVAEAPIPVGAVGALTVEGVFRFKAAGEVTQGALVYLDSNGKVTTTATSNKLLGVAWTAATAANVDIDVCINFGDSDTLPTPPVSGS